MATDSSFDIVSKVDLQELRNAVDQARKEIESRFDFKGSVSEIDLDEKALTMTLTSDNETRMKSVVDVLQSKMHRRGIDIRALDMGEVEDAARGTVRQEVKIRQGLDSDNAKKVVKLIKDKGLKVQAAIQGDQVRVTGKSRDDLQTVIAMLRAAELDVPLQFVNYR
ncbi:MAG: YajQ family cyclic di-GMP-binding protein [Capsulimonadales bacterium]|nr:YajQ family cyclic di-GMP-binding protein [Capsulimonadales bacterium]